MNLNNLRFALKKATCDASLAATAASIATLDKTPTEGSTMDGTNAGALDDKEG